MDLKRTELETENLEREIRLEIHTAWLIYQESIDQLDAQGG